MPRRTTVAALATVGLVVVGLLLVGWSETQDEFRQLWRPSLPWASVESPYEGWGPAPLPTGAWRTNLVLGTAPGIAVPFGLRFSGGSLELGYGYARRTATTETVVDPFVPDVRIAGDEDPKVVAFDALTLTIKFKDVTLYAARGSPYVTLEIVETPLRITWPAGVARFGGVGADRTNDDPTCAAHKACSKAGLLGDCCPTPAGDVLDCCTISETKSTGTSFDIVAGDGFAWRLYTSTPVTLSSLASEPTTLVVVVVSNNNNNKSPVVLRIAHAPDSDAAKLLDAHCETYAVAGRVTYTNATDYAFHWTTTSIVKRKKKKKKKKKAPLLSLALPHHAASFVTKNASVLTSLVGTWWAIKGPLTPVLGRTWRMRIPLDQEPPGLFAPRPPRDEMTIALLVSADVEALPSVVDTAKEIAFARASGVYTSGKRATKFASLAVAAKAAGLDDAAERAALAAAGAVAPWLDPAADLLVYDKTFGGICTRAGLLDVNADFGNGKYNDHHFHYGYLIYAAAVAIDILGPDKFHEAALAFLMADVATPLENDDDSVLRRFLLRRRRRRNLFPVARHKDFFAGHSWASGVFPLADGKSQESISEAIHCYYGVTLLGKALGDPEVAAFGDFLLRLELQAGRTYWHVMSLYPTRFRDANSIAAVVGAGDLHAATWFASNAALAHLVSALPFTPVTELLLVSPYVQIAERDVARALENDVDDDAPLQEDGIDLAPWRSLYLQLLAVVDPEKARRRVLKMGLNDNKPVLDTTQSLGAMLYWINTRPTPAPPEGSTHLPPYLLNAAATQQYQHIEYDDDLVVLNSTSRGTNNHSVPGGLPRGAACADYPKCRNLGISGDCCPAPGGVDLWCCS